MYNKSNRNNKQINTDNAKLVRLDAGWHRILKIDAAKAGVSIRELLEACLVKAYEQIKEDYGLVD